MILLKGVTIQQPAPLQAAQKLLPAKLDHGVVEGAVMPPDNGESLYEAGPDWLEQAFNNGYDLIEEAEDVIDSLLNNYGKHIPKTMRKRLLAVQGDLEEYIRFYEGENV